MIIKKILILFALLFAVQTPAYCWFFDKPDAELLQEALTSDDPKTVDQCLDHQIEKRNYIAALRLKHHAMQMVQKERGRISGIPGSSTADIAQGLAPWKKIIEKADSLSMKKNAFRQPVVQQ